MYLGRLGLLHGAAQRNNLRIVLLLPTHQLFLQRQRTERRDLTNQSYVCKVYLCLMCSRIMSFDWSRRTVLQIASFNPIH